MGLTGVLRDGLVLQVGQADTSRPAERIEVPAGTQRLETHDTYPIDAPITARILAFPPKSYCKVRVNPPLSPETQGSAQGADRPRIEVECTRPVKQVSVGGSFACALMANGTVRCWGDNSYGQCANATTQFSVAGLNGAEALYTESASVCVRMEDRTARCWGNRYSPTNPNPRFRSSPSMALPGVTGIAQLMMGHGMCVLGLDGHVTCWDGINEFSPSSLPPAKGMAAYCGLSCLCLLLDGGRVVCNGEPHANGLPDPRFKDIPDLFGAERLQGSLAVVFGLASPGNFYRWNALPRYQYVVPPGLSGVVDVGGTPAYSCAVLTDGRVRCWLTQTHTEAGARPKYLTSSPDGIVPGLTGIIQLSLYDEFACFLSEEGDVRCVGQNYSGQTGGGSPIPVALKQEGASIVQMVSGLRSTCALYQGGAIQCWGTDSNGNTDVPGDLLFMSETTALASTDYATFAIGKDGRVRAWGIDTNGESRGGMAAGNRSWGPGVLQISGGHIHACAVMADGTLRCWGADDVGQTAGGDATSPLAGLSGVVEVASGANHTCARFRTGALRCWGYNAHGQTFGGSVDRDLPGLSGVVSVAAGREHTCAALADGSVRCWGDTQFAQTGGSDPRKPVPGLSDIVRVFSSSRANHTCALRKTGALRCWGNQQQFQTGKSSPSVDLPGLSGVESVVLGRSYTCAVVKGGQAYCWGDDSEGALTGTAQAISTVDLAPLVP